ncbi:MAG: hypothetical protein ABI537_07745 [Casimicrobiaceae bacterium]
MSWACRKFVSAKGASRWPSAFYFRDPDANLIEMSNYVDTA